MLLLVFFVLFITIVILAILIFIVVLFFHSVTLCFVKFAKVSVSHRLLVSKVELSLRLHFVLVVAVLFDCISASFLTFSISNFRLTEQA